MKERSEADAERLRWAAQVREWNRQHQQDEARQNWSIDDEDEDDE